MAKVSQPWDAFMKMLLRKEAQALASLALPGVVVGDALDKEFQVKNIVGDFFFLWELPPEILKQPGFEALLPLLPLTKGGKNLETVDEMIKELIARDRSDLLELGHFLTKLGHGSTIAQFLLEKDAGLIAARQGQQPDWANL